MDKMMRFIDCYVPVTTCNLRCKYCYIAQTGKFKNEPPKFQYSPEHIGKALSPKRIGGLAHINMCGGGETLIPKEMPNIIKEILKQGHYVFVVTNGTLTNRLEEISKFPKEMLNRLGFKFSFHFEELERLNMFEQYFKNVKMMQEAGCSISVELTTFDDLIDRIDEIKDICQKYLGANCHVTIGRDDTDPKIPIKTKLTKEEYKKTWGDEFESDMFNFKLSTYNIKRKEFCYAGAWSGYLNIGTGRFTQCYASNVYQNIFKDLSKPVKFLAIGKCKIAHCYNSHAFLTLGLIPELETPGYDKIRNRITITGEEWLQPKMKQFISQKLYENNEQYSKAEKNKVLAKNKLELVKTIGGKLLKKYE